jgi:hypothetical protein
MECDPELHDLGVPTLARVGGVGRRPLNVIRDSFPEWNRSRAELEPE